MAKRFYSIYRSSHDDPRINLALEEHFLATVKADEVILFFWQSKNAVVIGRNQNPYQECNIAKLAEDDVTMVRRLSGGGAVYHDLGNLNYSFIARDLHYNEKAQFQIILDALKTFGIEGVFNGRNDLTVHNRKFSGNAFIHEEDRHLHHGTLLIDVAIEKVSDYLSVSHKKLETKGFDSVRSRIINLKELNQTLTVNHLIDSIKDIIGSNFQMTTYDTIDFSDDKLKAFLDKYHSHEWNYGDCADFDTTFEEQFSWGLITANFKVQDGKLMNLDLYTDALETKAFATLRDALNTLPLSMPLIEKKIKESPLNKTIQEDLIQTFKNTLFT